MMESNSNNKPLISVIVPIYKVEKYLDKCVESIVNQTYKNLEIILVDDGSPDNCPTMCDGWAKKDKRIKVIHKKNGGLSSARNTGLDVSTGDFIMFVDSDDFCASEICETLLNLVKENKVDFAMCDAQLFYENHPIKLFKGQPQIHVYHGQKVIDQIYSSNIRYLVTAWGKLYKRELFNNMRYSVGKLHEDVFVCTELLHKTTRFVYINSQMYYYLQRATSITGNRTEKNIQDLFEAYMLQNKFLNEKYPQNIERNNQLLLTMLRLLCCSNIKNKKLRDKIFTVYKSYYKMLEKHDTKNLFFYNFTWLYMLMLKIKKLKGRGK